MKNPKIKIGRSCRERVKMDKSHDVHTTMNVGFVMPSLFKQVIPQEKIKLRTNKIVRLAPMPCPTFGRLNLRTYNYFVPLRDVFMQFDSLMTETEYYAAVDDANTISTKVPQIKNSDLSKILLAMSGKITLYECLGSSVANHVRTYGNVNLTAQPTNAPSWLKTLHKVGSYTPALACVNVDQSDTRVTLDSADYIYTHVESGTTYLVCYKYGLMLNNILKILQGCGFFLNVSDDEQISLLPFFAYYYAYYQLFNPQRLDEANSTWKSTACYKLIEFFHDAPSKIDISSGTNYNSSFAAKFELFLSALANCYYTEDPNYFSCQTCNASTSLGTMNSSNTPFSSDVVTLSDPYIEHSSQLGGTKTTQNIGVLSSGDEVRNQLSTTYGLTRTAMRLVNILQKYVNKNTVIGGRIDEYMKAHFGSVWSDNETHYIGGDSVMVRISDVVATNQSSDVNLGEYAGKGYSANEGDTLSFTASQEGYIIQLSTIVPDGGFIQGTSPELFRLTKYDFYHPEFDSVGLVPTTTTELFNDYSVEDASLTSAAIRKTFGLKPRYLDYKVAKNQINGGFALRSQRDNYLPYCLDRYIIPNQLRYTSLDASGNYQGVKVDLVDPSVFVATSKWRFINKYPEIGNFDRIFYEQGANTPLLAGNDAWYFQSDNYIVQFNHELTSYAPMLSVSESYDTDAFDNNTDAVEKS